MLKHPWLSSQMCWMAVDSDQTNGSTNEALINAGASYCFIMVGRHRDQIVASDA